MTINVEQTTNKKQLLIPALFTLTAFTGAALLFIVEPLIAKLLLPEFGGASSVWTTSTFFFQVIMLLGYLFVHGSARFGPKRHPFLQLIIIVPALLFIPIALPAAETVAFQEPFARLLLTLAIAIGLPFAVLSTTGPLIQRWYSWSGAVRAEDPYFLYAASNAGSFIGLLAYPFLIEPFLSLDQQRNIWSVAFVVFLALVVTCGVVVLRTAKQTQQAQVAAETEAPALKPKRQLWWILLAFIPASLQLGVTTHLTTDVASFPLLFIIPLAIYLATMIAAFARKSKTPPKTAIWVAVAVLGVAIVCLNWTGVPAAVIFITILATLAAVSYAAHATLAADRPHTKYLTRYFVFISLGGALGGAFNSLIAPFLFVKPIEFPLVLALVPILLLVVVKRKVFVYGLVAVLALLPLTQLLVGDGSVRGRTFYGAWEVVSNDRMNVFSHGTTIHGAQFIDPELKNEPTTYYAKGTPLQNVMELSGRKETTVVGLGAGAIAAYGEPGENMNFIEIDPSVIDVAWNSDLFTFLSDSKANVTTEEGDGRLAMESVADSSQDLVVLDAFSSDSIPVHLLTEEAFGTYFQKLENDGVVAVHISNRVFDLRPVLVNNAEKFGYTVLHKTSQGESRFEGATASWVVMTKDPKKVDDFQNENWVSLNGTEKLQWTDDYSSVLQAMDLSLLFN